MRFCLLQCWRLPHPQAEPRKTDTRPLRRFWVSVPVALAPTLLTAGFSGVGLPRPVPLGLPAALSADRVKPVVDLRRVDQGCDDDSSAAAARGVQRLHSRKSSRTSADSSGSSASDGRHLAERALPVAAASASGTVLVVDDDRVCLALSVAVFRKHGLKARPSSRCPHGHWPELAPVLFGFCGWVCFPRTSRALRFHRWPRQPQGRRR